MSTIMQRPGEPPVPIPPEVERAAIEAGSEEPITAYITAWLKDHPAEAKAARKAAPTAAPVAAAQED